MCGVFRQLLCHPDFKENFSCTSKAILGTVYPTSYSPGISHALQPWSQAHGDTIASGSPPTDQGNTIQVCAFSCQSELSSSSILTGTLGSRWILVGSLRKKIPVEGTASALQSLGKSRDTVERPRDCLGKTRKILNLLFVGKGLESDFV